jgi:membrane protein YqaA with SNARE-associated domain
MNMTEAYSLLFVDTFSAHLVFYGAGEMVFPSMLALGGYDLRFIFVISLFSYLLAFLVNFWLGLVMHKIYESSIDNESSMKNYQKFKYIFEKYGKWILCLTVFTFIGPVVNVLAGFVKFNIRQAAVIAIVCKIAYYVLLYIK